MIGTEAARDERPWGWGCGGGRERDEVNKSHQRKLGNMNTEITKRKVGVVERGEGRTQTDRQTDRQT